MIRKFGEWNKLNENEETGFFYELDPQKLIPLDPNTPDPRLFNKDAGIGGSTILRPDREAFFEIFGGGRENWDLYNDFVFDEPNNTAWRIFAEVKNKRIKNAIKRFNEISKLTVNDLQIERNSGSVVYRSAKWGSTIAIICKFPGIRKFNLWKDSGSIVNILSTDDYLEFFNSPAIKQKIFRKLIKDLLTQDVGLFYLKE